MTAAVASAQAPAHPTPRAADTRESAPATSDWPFNLTLLLGVLVVFAINIAAVLYLAAQMPT